MKHTITTLLFLGFAITGLAQSEPTATVPIPTYRDVQDSLFQHLDKSRLTTGVLYDRA